MPPMIRYMFYYYTRFSRDGHYKAVSYSDQARAPYQNIPVEDVYKVYRALKTWHSETNKQENKIEIKLCPGTVINFILQLT